MFPRPPRKGRGPTIAALGLALALALAVLASFTTAFTWGADVVTAVPIGLGALVLSRHLRPARSSTGAPGPASQSKPARQLTRSASVWLGLAAAVVSWELYCYASAPRADHPTLSVLITSATSTPIGRGVSFLAWLALGVALVLQ
jgi:hypothetical protein